MNFFGVLFNARQRCRATQSAALQAGQIEKDRDHRPMEGEPGLQHFLYKRDIIDVAPAGLEINLIFKITLFERTT